MMLVILLGVVLPLVVTGAFRSKPFRWFLLKINYQTINKDIFDDIIDYKTQTGMRVYLKNSELFYVGTFVLKEEDRSGKDFHIALINYALMDKNTYEVKFRPEYNSVALINLNNIERIETIYTDTSEAWKRLNGEK